MQRSIPVAVSDSPPEERIELARRRLVTRNKSARLQFWNRSSHASELAEIQNVYISLGLFA